MYIGKQPLIGNFQVCDAISTVNNQAAYTLQVGGVNVFPETVNNMIVSVNGVIQKPTASYTVAGSTITFTSNLVTGDVIDFIQILGSVLDLGTPSDNTVTTAKIADGAVTAAKLASGVGGKVLQVVTATDSTQRDTNSTSYVTASNTLAVAITPSATSSKVYINLTFTGFQNVSGKASLYTLYRGSTDLSANGDFIHHYDSDSGGARVVGHSYCISILDSPNTTNATTYQLYIKNESGGTSKINHDGATSTITAFEIGA